MWVANKCRGSLLHWDAQGFTRTDLMFVVLVCLSVGALVISCETQPRRKRSELTCPVNLQLIALACQTFQREHSGFFPCAVSTNRGGTLEFGASGNQTFRHFQILSVDLSAPRVLVCPQDSREAANSWNSLENWNVSYFVGLDSEPNSPLSIVAGDRNVSSTASVILTLSRSTPPKWEKGIGLHG